VGSRSQPFRRSYLTKLQSVEFVLAGYIAICNNSLFFLIVHRKHAVAR
jgi:hypothetical protein